MDFGLGKPHGGDTKILKVDSFDDAIRRSFGNPATPDILGRLETLTGLKAGAINFSGQPLVKIDIPDGVDREKFVDRFIDSRNKAGVKRDDMAIRDNISGTPGNHDPHAFYLESQNITPTMVSKLERYAKDHPGAFNAFPPAEAPKRSPGMAP